MTDISATLAERGGRYGLFSDQAEIEQDLMERLARERGWSRLAADQKSAIQMVCVKLARIVNGDPNYPDNWHDIIGYARLIDDRLSPGSKPLVETVQLGSIAKQREPEKALNINS